MKLTRRALMTGLLSVVASIGLNTTNASAALANTYADFVTSQGTFKVKLFDKKAPKTVANFVGLAEGTREWKDPRTGQKVKKPFYNGLTFHRIISGFMIQGAVLLAPVLVVQDTILPMSFTLVCGIVKPEFFLWLIQDQALMEVSSLLP